MKTDFTAGQLADPEVRTSADVIRRCVRCGFCLSTCPTYVLGGDERDSPRGRIYLIRQMLEREAAPSAETVKHLDRCLSCLACETTCPSGVSYRRLIDHARAYIEAHYRRPAAERLLRGLLARTLPYRRRFRAALMLAQVARPLEGLFGTVPALRPLAAMLALAPKRQARAADPSKPALATRRVAFLQGCVEPVLGGAAQDAARRLLARMGCEAVAIKGEGCCGALPHHLGRAEQALAMARRNVDLWFSALCSGQVDAIVTTASGCGSMLRDYAHLLREDPDYAEKAAAVVEAVRDISELIGEIGLPPVSVRSGISVAYHPACSLQHGQQIGSLPADLLREAGFRVSLPANAHLCCGSAGTYNILQPDIATQLGIRKAQALEASGPTVIATGNIGCITQIARFSGTPVLHVVQLLDWATGGPELEGLRVLSAAPAGAADSVGLTSAS